MAVYLSIYITGIIILLSHHLLELKTTITKDFINGTILSKYTYIKEFSVDLAITIGWPIVSIIYIVICLNVVLEKSFDWICFKIIDMMIEVIKMKQEVEKNNVKK